MYDEEAMELDGLPGDIARYIVDASVGEFEPLFLQLFERHYQLNEPFRTYCDNLKRNPDNVDRWQDVPAVPAQAFKTQVLSCVPESEISIVFHSSGTTGQETSKHYLDPIAESLYRVSLKVGFIGVVPPDAEIVALLPPPNEAPHSSLSYMLGALDTWAFYWEDRERLHRLMDMLTESCGPVSIFGTALAFLDLFESTSKSWQLPDDSWIIETGGFKGRTRTVERGDLYAMFADRLGVRTPFAISEYGMTEMSSQYYGSPDFGFTGGHWMRTRIVDPISGEDADEGQLVHYDLANWNSVAAIETQDVGRRVVGSQAFDLIGRAPDADSRGCSLSV
jgi:hypothetical protein